MGQSLRSERVRALIAGVATVAVSTLAAPVAIAAERVPVPREPQHPRPTGRAIVFSGPATTASAAVHRAGLEATTIPELDAFAVEPPRGDGVAALRRALRDEPGVETVESEYRRFVRLTPDDPGPIRGLRSETPTCGTSLSSDSPADGTSPPVVGRGWR